jgi:hypothetical protein
MTTKTKLRRPANAAQLVAAIEIRDMRGNILGSSVATGPTAEAAIKAAQARLPEVP